MLNDLITHLTVDEDDPDVRSIVIASAWKGKVFSSGHDLKEFVIVPKSVSVFKSDEN